LRMRGRLDSSLKLWLSRGQRKDDLLGPGLPLAESEKLAKDFGSSLSREQIDYISASVAERNRRKQAKARIRYALMAAISALAIVAGFQWLQAEHHRQSAENNAAMAQAEAARTKEALASEAGVAAKLQEQLREASWASFNQAERQFQLGEWPEGIALLARAIRFDRQNQVASEPFSPDGARVLTASKDKTAKLWDIASGKLLASFDHQNEANNAAFSPDGARILTASADKTARLPPCHPVFPFSTSSAAALRPARCRGSKTAWEQYRLGEAASHSRITDKSNPLSLCRFFYQPA
jgi:Flp pilus assembly pilin Flp